jgi:hypothetical protein
MVNELAIIIFALDDDDLVIHTINGLGDEYKEFVLFFGFPNC